MPKTGCCDTYRGMRRDTRPDLLFILADDLGFSDIGCFGAEIETPILDGLARRGVRQTQMYNCARCCPTRAALLTGVHPHQAGIGFMTVDTGRPSYRGFLSPGVPTVAERLRAVGYRTWISGKWHVGGDYDMERPEQWAVAGDPGHPLPEQRGFDRVYSVLAGAGSYFDPPTLWESGRFVFPESLPSDYYLTDELGRRAAGFVDEVPEGQPFFGYLAFTAPHWPLHAPEADIARYRGRYQGGWERLREERLRRQVAQGVFAEGQRLSPPDERSKPWASAEDPAWEAERMAVYAAQVSSMDRAIGVVVDRLADRGRLDNTLVVFVSDNGGCAEYLREGGEEGTWPEIYGGKTKSGTERVVGNRRGVAPGPAETFMSYDLDWSAASNTPFRKFKAWVHEGGISTPLVASWPLGLPAGVTTGATGHVVDLVSTACSLAGAAVDGLDGSDLRPAWEGVVAEVPRSEPLCWEHRGHAAIREGRWKLVRAGQDAAWELYDVVEDRIESQDRAAAEPEVAARLERAWRAWADRSGILPFPVRPV